MAIESGSGPNLQGSRRSGSGYENKLIKNISFLNLFLRDCICLLLNNIKILEETKSQLVLSKFLISLNRATTLALAMG